MRKIVSYAKKMVRGGSAEIAFFANPLLSAYVKKNVRTPVRKIGGRIGK